MDIKRFTGGLIVLASVLAPSVAFAQGAVGPQDMVLIVGRTSGGVNYPIRVNPSGAITIASGTISGTTTDADDNSIPTGQTNDNVNSLGMVYNGSSWVRDTVGTLGTPSTVVRTVQGGAAMYPIAANITQVGGTTVSGTAPLPVRAANSTGFIADDVADDAVSAGNPVPVGALVITALSGFTGLSANDRAILSTDADRALYIRNHSKADAFSGVLANTDGASTQIVAAAAANVRYAITDFTCVNAHATTWASVDLRDGTAGSVLWTFPVPGQAAGGGMNKTWSTPIYGSAATALAIDASAAVTTITCSVAGYKVR